MTARPSWTDTADVVVIGTGAAGLAAALAAHRAGRSVVVLSKADSKRGATATRYAQGGIAVVLPGNPENGDSVEAHAADTLAAGAGLCDADAVYSIVADGYRAVSELVGDGARFDESVPGQWALTREGGHSRRRIVHAGGDATGAEVQRALDQAAATLDIRTSHVALRVLHDGTAVTGVLAGNADGYGIISAPSVILACGGLGQLYAATTNPEAPPAMGSRWPCGRVSPSATSSSSSSTRPCFSMGAPVAGVHWSPRRSAARARYCLTAKVIRSRRAFTRWVIWRLVTSSRRPSTRG